MNSQKEINIGLMIDKKTVKAKSKRALPSTFYWYQAPFFHLHLITRVD
jgi:hypothetical protein